jgi:hypothetical protein
MAVEPEIVRTVQVSAASFVYVVAYLALRLLPNQIYAGYFNTIVQVIGDAACALLAFRAARAADRTWRGFFLGIGVGSALLMVANLAWGIVINIWVLDPNKTLESLTYRVPYLLCLVAWTYAWLDLVVRQVNRGAGISLIAAAVLVGVCLAGLLVRYYGPLILDSANPHRVFVFLYVGLEVAGLIFSIGAAIIEIQPFPVLIAVGYATLVAADFVFNTNELRDTIPQNSLAEIPWTLAQASIALGLSWQRRSLAELAAADGGEAAESHVGIHFAIPLLSLTLGAGATGALIARFAQPDTAAFGYFLFCAAGTAFAISAIARAHARSFSRAWKEAVAAAARGPAPAQVSSGRELLRLFGSAAMIHRTHALLLRHRNETIPCSWDRMFPIAEAWNVEKPRQVFIAMPFSQAWSADIEKWIRGQVEALGWSALRADELFDTRDVLNGIWKSLCSSEIVVADLTGRNANVLYEIGLAHCLGKPVVFTCQQIADVPFDLSTRRVVLYDSREVAQSSHSLQRALLGCVRPGS